MSFSRARRPASAALLLMASLSLGGRIPADARAVRPTAHIEQVLTVVGLPGGRYRMVEDLPNDNREYWLVGKDRALWLLLWRHHQLTAVSHGRLPAGHLVAWPGYSGKMAVLQPKQIVWLNQNGQVLRTRTPLPSGSRWIGGPGIQVWRGGTVYNLTAAMHWHALATFPVLPGERFLGAEVGVDLGSEDGRVDEAPVVALFRRGNLTTVAVHNPETGMRRERFHLGPVTTFEAAGDTIVIRRHPLTTITVAPTDDIVTETRYQDAEAGTLGADSPMLVTRRGQVTAFWEPGFYPAGRTPVLTVHDGSLLAATGRAYLVKNRHGVFSLVRFSPPFENEALSPVEGHRLPSSVVRRVGSGWQAYRIGRRWVGWSETQRSILLGRRRYRVGAGTIIADDRRLWLLGSRQGWTVGPTGSVHRIPWPQGLTSSPQPVATARGDTLYAALDRPVGSASAQALPPNSNPPVHVALVRVGSRHARVLSWYPRTTGGATSMARSPHGELWIALSSGLYNRTFLYHRGGTASLAAWNPATDHWHQAAMPADVLRATDYAHTLAGNSIVNLVAEQGPRLFFLVQGNPSGTGLGFDGLVWEWQRGHLRYFDLPAYAMDYPVQLAGLPSGRVLVMSFEATAVIIPRHGLEYVGPAAPLPSEWLGARYLSNGQGAGGTTVQEVSTAKLHPFRIFHETLR